MCLFVIPSVILKYVCESIFKSVSTSSVLPGNPISDSKIRSSKLGRASSVCPSKRI